MINLGEVGAYPIQITNDPSQARLGICLTEIRKGKSYELNVRIVHDNDSLVRSKDTEWSYRENRARLHDIGELNRYIQYEVCLPGFKGLNNTSSNAYWQKSLTDKAANTAGCSYLDQNPAFMLELKSFDCHSMHTRGEAWFSVASIP